MALEVFFVTGTGTDIGKTYIASRWAETRRERGQSVGVYKPVASGCVADDGGTLIADDAERLWDAAGRPLDLHAVCPQRFARAVAPPEAAAAEGKCVDEALLLGGAQPWIDGTADRPFDLLLVEGAGGLFSPISESMLNIDFARRLREKLPQLKVLLVAPNRLGVIHDCVATVRAAQSHGITIDRIILNPMDDVWNPRDTQDESTASNAGSVERWTGVKVIEGATVD